MFHKNKADVSRNLQFRLKKKFLFIYYFNSEEPAVDVETYPLYT